MLSPWLLLLPFAAAAAPSERGDLTHFGNQWGWSGTAEAFVPQLVMYRTPPHFYGNPGQIDQDIRLFLGEHGFVGFHVFLACRWFDIGESDCREAPPRNPPLDPRTFEALEMLIRKTYAAGGMVHLWSWGDEERGQTPSAHPEWGGLDGPVARKVEREIARRLGPLPGWSMGYGFDLDEWVSPREIHAWRERLQSLLPRFHLLGGRPAGPNRGRGHERFERWNRDLDYASYEHHKPTYAIYVDALAENPDKPVMSEDRFRVLADTDPKHYTPEEVRRGLWHSALAGGVANIWGYLREGGTHELGSARFPNREEIRTYSEFMRGRFLKDMVRCSEPRSDPRQTTLCLAEPSGRRAIFYREDAAFFEVGAAWADRSLTAVAVDAKRPYAEVAVELDASGGWRAPRRSDWALALGEFDRRDAVTPSTGALATAGALRPPSGLEVVSVAESAVELAWRDRSHGEAGFEVERAVEQEGLPGPYRPLVVVAADRTSFTDDDLPPGETYWYRVRAVGPSGASLYSPSVRVHTRTGVLVTNLSPVSLQVGSLGVGDRYYVDRDYRLSRFPPALAQAVWIRTANDDKLVEATPFVTFQVHRPVTVYVGFDRRAKRLPNWLRGFEPALERIVVEGDAMRYFELYKKEFAPGEVALGGNSAEEADWGSEGRSHYVVAVLAR